MLEGSYITQFSGRNLGKPFSFQNRNNIFTGLQKVLYNDLFLAFNIPNNSFHTLIQWLLNKTDQINCYIPRS